MADRPNWHSDHPSTCTCVECTRRRLGRGQRREVQRRQTDPRRRGFNAVHGRDVPPSLAMYRGGKRDGSKWGWWLAGILLLLLVAGLLLYEDLGLDTLLEGDAPEPTRVTAIIATGTPTPARSPIVTPTPTQTSTPVAPTPTPVTPTQTSMTSQQRLTAPDIQELRVYVLELVNDDRSAHDLPPVALGHNEAAQLHAEDMLKHHYQGHWWTDGRKPYMVYSETGGTSYVSENAASSGWTKSKWQSSNCDSSRVNCQIPTPVEAVKELQWSMMYDDAHADWGHRDNILRVPHRAVNIGIAFDGKRVTFIQHVEGGTAEAYSPPTLSDAGVLSFSLAKREAGLSVGSVVTV